MGTACQADDQGEAATSAKVLLHAVGSHRSSMVWSGAECAQILLIAGKNGLGAHCQRGDAANPRAWAVLAALAVALAVWHRRGAGEARWQPVPALARSGVTLAVAVPRLAVYW